MLDENERCQAIIRGSHQCDAAKEGVSDYCIKHGGNKANEADQKQRLYDFKSQAYQARITKFMGNAQSKDLSSEIALLRMMIEERMNLIESPTDMLLHSGPLADLIIRVEKVVVSCHKLEKAMGMHVDKSAILKFAGDVVQIITEEVTDETITRKIADRMLDAIKDVGKQDD